MFVCKGILLVALVLMFIALVLTVYVDNVVKRTLKQPLPGWWSARLFLDSAG